MPITQKSDAALTRVARQNSILGRTKKKRPGTTLKAQTLVDRSRLLIRPKPRFPKRRHKYATPKNSSVSVISNLRSLRTLAKPMIRQHHATRYKLPLEALRHVASMVTAANKRPAGDFLETHAFRLFTQHGELFWWDIANHR